MLIIILTNIFNICIRNCYSSTWKLASTFSTRKPGKDYTRLANHRLIVLLFFISKFYEKEFLRFINDKIRKKNQNRVTRILPLPLNHISACEMNRPNKHKFKQQRLNCCNFSGCRKSVSYHVASRTSLQNAPTRNFYQSNKNFRILLIRTHIRGVSQRSSFLKKKNSSRNASRVLPF